MVQIYKKRSKTSLFNAQISFSEEMKSMNEPFGFPLDAGFHLVLIDLIVLSASLLKSEFEPFALI